MNISVGVQAVIVEQGRILLVKKKDNDSGEMSYILPGGKQEFGETMEQAVCREVMEEVGVCVEVSELLFLREFIGANHQTDEVNRQLHIVSPIFRCHMLPGQEIPLISPHPDEDQIGVEWMPVDELHHICFYPKQLVPKLIEVVGGIQPRYGYVGDMN